MLVAMGSAPIRPLPAGNMVSKGRLIRPVLLACFNFSHFTPWTPGQAFRVGKATPASAGEYAQGHASGARSERHAFQRCEVHTVLWVCSHTLPSPPICPRSTAFHTDMVSREPGLESMGGIPGQQPYEVSMDPDSARSMATQGGSVLMLGVPSGAVVGVDHQAFGTGAMFKGIKMLPPGMHFFSCAAPGHGEAGGSAVAPATGFFLKLAPCQVVVKVRPTHAHAQTSYPHARAPFFPSGFWTAAVQPSWPAKTLPPTRTVAAQVRLNTRVQLVNPTFRDWVHSGACGTTPLPSAYSGVGALDGAAGRHCRWR